MTVDTASPSVFDAGLPTLDTTSPPLPPSSIHGSGRPSNRRPSRWDRSGPRSFPTNLCGRCCVTPLHDPARHEPDGPGHHVGTAVGQDRQQPAGPGGAQHHRVCAAWCPRRSPRARVARLHDTIVDVINDLIDRRCRRRPLRRRHRHRPALPRPDHLRAARRAPRGLGTVLDVGRRHLHRLHLQSRRLDRPSSCARGANSTPTSTTWSPAGGTP